jgi:DNA uptake protein ComE-like DNA-binding protein
MNKIALMLAPLAVVASLAAAQTSKPAKPAAAPVKTCESVLKAKVNINKAPLEGMKCLPGFVTSIAQDVILNRPFVDGKDFMIKIEITGKKLWPKIEKYVTFK